MWACCVDAIWADSRVKYDLKRSGPPSTAQTFSASPKMVRMEGFEPSSTGF
jgi:hypothetical protein